MQIIGQVLTLAGTGARLIDHECRSWASGTFHGCRHVIVVRFTGDICAVLASRFTDALRGHEFTACGQLVVNVGITCVKTHTGMHPRTDVTAELLLLDEG